MTCGRAVRSTFVLLFMVLFGLDCCGPAAAQTFTHSRVEMHEGEPTLDVDGRPFFFYGAAFFYERIPAAQWRASMSALRSMGFNTLDLYVPWNWHERSDGEFDFSGRTNARRDLRSVLRLAREFAFKIVVRPGPVIRNEWRNGGYPAWLLTRPEYDMPLHDILEGRYPATATLQNANSDDAAAQWLHNATHMQYARRWLQTVLREFVPVADLVIAVQLDDDQGAYIDNQTWPAPHFQAYVAALETTVRSIVGARLPLFINTYEMKVTASAPVWAMGNWYQSDAYALGEHDRTALEFSTGLLQTQTRFPVAMSEFQAGWLAPPEDPAPRPADPANTTLALHTLLGMGARGVIDFPAQDTLNPAGWEAPFANAAYRWDAALDRRLQPSARYLPTADFGTLVRAGGTQLAAAQRLSDGAVAYLSSAYDPARLTNADVFAIAARTQDAQHACRRHALTCDLIDLRFAGAAKLAGYPFVVVPPTGVRLPFEAAVRAKLAAYVRAGGRVLAEPPAIATPRNGGIADATVLLAPDGTAFLDIVNYDDTARRIARTRLGLPHGRSWIVGPLIVPARDAMLLRSGDTRDSRASPQPAQAPPASPQPSIDSCATAEPEPSVPAAPPIVRDDRACDGFARLTLANDRVAVTLAPDAGARAFTFSARSGSGSTINAFTSVGALRDDVEIQPPVSTTDRIGKYTRSFPAGTFNRPYFVEHQAATADAASVTLRYAAPDMLPNGAVFTRTLQLERGKAAFTVAQEVTFAPGVDAGAQRAVRYDSFDSRGMQVLDERTHGQIGFYSADHQTVASITWPPGDVEDAQLMPERSSTVVRLRFAANGIRRTRYALSAVTGISDARAELLKERSALDAKP